MQTRPSAVIGLLAAGMLLGGCRNASSTTGAIGEWFGDVTNSLADASTRDTPVTVVLDGPVALDVDSFNGDVIIECDPALEQGSVTVTRTATHGFSRGKEARASLDAIAYSVNLVPGDVGQVLMIRTWTTDIEPHFQRAHLRIKMPEVDGVYVKTSNGNVVARDIEGAVDITTSFGDVRVMTNHPMNEAVTIINNSGTIDYRVRGESSGELDCLAVRGKVHHNVRYGEMIVHNGTSWDRLKATFNSGTNPVVLRAANGDVRIAVVAEPMEVGEVIVP